jgi:hypothetical protein
MYQLNGGFPRFSSYLGPLVLVLGDCWSARICNSNQRTTHLHIVREHGSEVLVFMTENGKTMITQDELGNTYDRVGGPYSNYNP